jgi:hypothetical protein
MEIAPTAQAKMMPTTLMLSLTESSREKTGAIILGRVKIRKDLNVRNTRTVGEPVENKLTKFGEVVVHRGLGVFVAVRGERLTLRLSRSDRLIGSRSPDMLGAGPSSGILLEGLRSARPSVEIMEPIKKI